MKLLIAYDGSEFSKSAIEDLTRAGLPQEGVSVTVLSVGEVRSTSDLNLEPALSIASYAVDNIQETIQFAREAAEEDAEDGAKEVRKLFPKWEVMTCARLHSPASTILEIADSWKPDLIVIGSHGRGALGRLFLGSVSLQVASEARCSVRIVREQDHPSKVPTLLLAFDGSKGAREVVHKLIHRTWPQDTKLHIVSVVNISVLATPEYVWLAGSDVGMYQEMKESRMGLPVSAGTIASGSAVAPTVKSSDLNSLFEGRLGGTVELTRSKLGVLNFTVEGSYAFSKNINSAWFHGGDDTKNNGPLATLEAGINYLFDLMPQSELPPVAIAHE